MSPSRIYHRPDSPLHGVRQCVDLSLWDILPLFQQCCSQLPESVGGVFRRLLTRLSSSSHKCSTGDKSELYGGLSSGTMLLFARKSWQTLATWERALSCCCTNVTATGRKMSSLYLTAVRFPGTTINGDFTPCQIPPHTITDPPPYLSLSKSQASANRSPRRRYRRRRPSARKRVNRDSSMKKTRLHCLIGKRLGACAVTQAIRRARRARLSGKPTFGRRARRPNSRNRFLTVFGWIRRLWLPTVFTAVSMALRWRLRRWARRMALSWRCDVTRGRPDRGRSATSLVSLRRRTRRSMVETCTPKCLATYCCLCPWISNAVAWPLWTSVSRTMTNKTSTVTKLADNGECPWSVPSGMTQCFPEHGGVISHGILRWWFVVNT